MSIRWTDPQGTTWILSAVVLANQPMAIPNQPFDPKKIPLAANLRFEDVADKERVGAVPYNGHWQNSLDVDALSKQELEDHWQELNRLRPDLF